MVLLTDWAQKDEYEAAVFAAALALQRSFPGGTVRNVWRNVRFRMAGFSVDLGEVDIVLEIHFGGRVVTVVVEVDGTQKVGRAGAVDAARGMLAMLCESGATSRLISCLQST